MEWLRKTLSREGIPVVWTNPPWPSVLLALLLLVLGLPGRL